jgi:hypothetical protein
MAGSASWYVSFVTWKGPSVPISGWVGTPGSGVKDGVVEGAAHGQLADLVQLLLSRWVQGRRGLADGQRGEENGNGGENGTSHGDSSGSCLSALMGVTRDGMLVRRMATSSNGGGYHRPFC